MGETLQIVPRWRGNHSAGYRSDEDDQWSPTSRSSHGFVDSVLIEQFSGSDSTCCPSEGGSQSSSSNFEQPVRDPTSWTLKLKEKALRSLVDGRAKKLLVKFVMPVNHAEDCTNARHRRHEAAAGLLKIVFDERNGREIVARRLVKTMSRQEEAIHALMKLNDDELLEAGFQAIHRFAPRPVSITLLRILMRYTPEPIFFEETISPALEDGNEGVMAMLYLATRRGKSFFHRIDPTLILGFCQRVAEAEELLSPKWYYGVKLLYNLFENTPSSEWKYSTLLPYLLSNVCSGIVKQGQAGPKPSAVEEPRGSSAFHEPWLLPLLPMCFEQLDDYPVTFPSPSTLKVFLELLISIVQPEDNSLRHLNTNRGWALRNLISLLEFPTPVTFISQDMLQRIGDLLTDIALHPYTLEPVQGVEVFEKDILRHFASNLDEWSVEGLCCLPESTFITALSSALKRRTLQLDSTRSNPYEPLSTVERLLWLSNKGSPYADSQRIHRVLVNSGACGFLVHVLSHSGALAPQDRGLWRAKGLAVTCLGNLMEHMNEEQCRNSIAKDTIDAVVAIKEDKEVPLAQKDQAIFTLQRYIKAVERWGIQPYYPENVLKLR